MNPVEQAILNALFTLCRDNRRICAASLGEHVGVTATRAASALCALERAGLCDASRARLTMLGLATAARQGSAQGGTLVGRRALREQPNARLSIAAQPSACL
jgi:hypothetical protein